MFTIDQLDNENKLYLLSNINGDITYPKLSIFDVKYNNEIINPFIDKLIDMNKSITKCKFIEWISCIDNYKKTKYKKYFNTWLYNINLNKYHKSSTTLTTYINRDDYVTIKILYDIYDNKYLDENYKCIDKYNFYYLQLPVYIYEIPINAKDYIHFDLYIHKPDEELSDYRQTVYIDKSYTENIQINIININNRNKYIYRIY